MALIAGIAGTVTSALVSIVIAILKQNLLLFCSYLFCFINTGGFMNRILLLIFLVVTVISIYPQQKQIELFELIRIFSPEDDSLLSWQTGTEDSTLISWYTQSFEDTGELDLFYEKLYGPFFKEGKALVAVDSIKLKGTNYNAEDPNWIIRVFGPRTGIAVVEIENYLQGDSCFQENHFTNYLKKNLANYKILLRHRYNNREYYLCELIIRGKASIYLFVRNGRGNDGTSGDVVILYQKPTKEFINRLWNIKL
jgi:hypothetical protein